MRVTCPIRAVAEKTGLSVHTIRAWEKRYGVLDPVRTETNRRMYREADIGRLILLQRAVEAGHSIGITSRRKRSLSLPTGWESKPSLSASVYPAVDHELPGELRRLRKELQRQVPILVGGRAASNYSEVLKEISALSAAESKSMQEALSRLKAASSLAVR